jgi:hypothetical protein
MEEIVEKLEEYLETHELSAEPLFIVPTKEGWAMVYLIILIRGNGK